MTTFLQALSDYAERIGVPSPMYRTVSVRYIIHLDREGQFQSIEDTTPPIEPEPEAVSSAPSQAKASSRQSGRTTQAKKPRLPLQLAVPDLKRTSGVRAKLFADRADYTLGWMPEGEEPTQVTERHANYVMLVRQCTVSTRLLEVAAVLRFLETLDLSDLDLPEEFDPDARITFVVDGKRVVDLPEVKQYWAGTSGVGVSGMSMQCCVCLQERPPVRRLSIPIMRMPGGQSTGIALIAMNEPAFMSYGLEHSLNSPICADCEQRCGTALNALLLDQNTHWIIDDRVYLFWPRDQRPLPMDQMLRESDPSEARKAFMAPRLGDREAAASTEGDMTPYYTAVVKANAARFVLLQWNEQPQRAVIRHLARYFEMGQVAVYDREEGQVTDVVLPIWQLSGATVRTGGTTRERARPVVEQSLLRLALEGQPLPLHLAQLVIKRVLTEGSMRPAHAALLQLYLLSQKNGAYPSADEDQLRQGSPYKRNGGLSMLDELQHSDIQPVDPIAVRVGLDIGATDTAYLTGRAIVLMEEIQYAAHRRPVNNSLRDRFLTMAAQQPQMAWAALLREVEPLLGKITRRNPPIGTLFEMRLGDLLAPISEYPRVFSYPEQARFLLASHKQRNYYILSKREARKRRLEKEEAEGQGPGDNSAILAEELAEDDGTQEERSE
jgi:CRISPR-associated protein Csd1